MKNFILGLFIGIFITVTLYFTPYIDPRFRTKIGHLLDKDIILLKNGNIIKGWILKKQKDKISIEIANGYIVLPYSDCEHIEENYLLKYMKELV